MYLVIAHDKDQGGNGEVRYNFTPDNTDIVNYFGIDAHTGWITNLVKLNREEKAEYKFYVTATDNGTPKHSTRTTVIKKCYSNIYLTSVRFFFFLGNHKVERLQRQPDFIQRNHLRSWS